MIEHIFFDVGDVLIHDFTDNERWKNFQRLIGVDESRFEEFDKVWLELTSESLTGFDVDEIKDTISQKFCLDLSADFSFLDMLTDQFSRNVAIEPVVFDLAENYKISLLTNMYPRMLSSIFDKNLIVEFDWYTIIDSSEVSLAKPDKKIYEFAENSVETESSKILFIDNTQENLDEAAKLGWQTVRYDIQKENSVFELKSLASRLSTLD